MEIEKAVERLEASVGQLREDMAVVKNDLNNHVPSQFAEVKQSIREVKGMIAGLGSRLDSSAAHREGSAVTWRAMSGWLVSAMLGLAYIIVEFVLKR